MTTRPPRWLFVCSGNICRSPLAKAICDSESDRRDLSIETDSAGTLGLVGYPVDPKAGQVAVEIGLDLGLHRSKALTAEQIRWADRVIVMTDEHLATIGLLAPEALDRVVPLGRIVGLEDIRDPHGSWFLRPYRQCREDLRKALRVLLDSPAARPVIS